MNPADYRVEPLVKRHDRAGFSCGSADLDRYLHQQAMQDVRRRVAVVYVMLDTQSDRLVGYHCLSAFSIHLRELPEPLVKQFPRYEALPAIMLGRLAVDLRYQGRGFGEILLIDAIRRALELSTQLGAMAIVVDAKDDDARAFYERYEFVRVVDREYRLFLPMSTIASLLT